MKVSKLVVEKSNNCKKEDIEILIEKSDLANIICHLFVGKKGGNIRGERDEDDS